jgi:hypothetical protein
MGNCDRNRLNLGCIGIVKIDDEKASTYIRNLVTKVIAC